MHTGKISAIGAARHERFLVAIAQTHYLDGGFIKRTDLLAVRGEDHGLASRQDLRPAVGGLATGAVELTERRRDTATDRNSGQATDDVQRRGDHTIFTPTPTQSG